MTQQILSIDGNVSATRSVLDTFLSWILRMLLTFFSNSESILGKQLTINGMTEFLNTNFTDLKMLIGMVACGLLMRKNYVVQWLTHEHEMTVLGAHFDNCMMSAFNHFDGGSLVNLKL